MFSDVFNDPNNIDILEAFIASYFDLTLEEVKGKIKVKPRRLSLDNKIEANSEVDLYLEMNGENEKVQKENEKKQEETTRLAKETLKLINDTLNGFTDEELKAKVIKLKEDGQRIIKELESK